MSYDESYRRIEHLLELRLNVLCEIELSEYGQKEFWRGELRKIYNELKELGWENQYKK
jgi:hypothetical protein